MAAAMCDICQRNTTDMETTDQSRTKNLPTTSTTDSNIAKTTTESAASISSSNTEKASSKSASKPTTLNATVHESNTSPIIESEPTTKESSQVIKSKKTYKDRTNKLPLNRSSNRPEVTHNYEENRTVTIEPTYDNLERYQSHRNKAGEILYEFPNGKTTAICNIINKFMSFEPVDESNINKDKYTTFMSMKEAKEYFVRKLHVFRDHNSFMQFQYPTALAYYQPVNYSPNNNIDLKILDVETLYDTSYVNDEILSFAMRCLNIVNMESYDHTTIPHVHFGTVLDSSNLVIKEGNSRTESIIKHINYTPSHGAMTQSLTESEEACSKEMKHWYCGSSKHYLSTILDCYAAKNQIISKYVNILHVSAIHWILLVAEISSDKPDFVPNVYTMDGMNCADNEAKNARLWYAKYFGLYVKQFYSANQLSDFDFDCHDVIDTKFNSQEANYIRDHIDRKKISILKHECKSPTIIQADGYNCGVIGLIHCIEIYRKSETFKHLSADDHHAALLRLRLNLLSMIKAIYEELNDNIYLQFQSHLFFHKQSGHWHKDSHLLKWDKVHSLFDADQYQYSPDNEKMMNANLMFMQLNEKMLKEDMHLAFPTQTPTPKKRPPSPKKSTFGSRKKRRKHSTGGKKTLAKTPAKTPAKSTSDNLTSSSKRSARKLKNKQQTGFLSGLYEYSNYSKKSLLHDFEHHRIRRVFDVSDTYLYLGNQSSEEQEVTTPKEIVNSLQSLFMDSYVSKEEIDNNEKSFQDFITKLEDLLSTYKTYFVMDLVGNSLENKKSKSYEVVAAVIVEDDLELNQVPHVLVHMMAIRRGYETLNHINFLLYNMIVGTKMAEMNFVIHKTFGTRNYITKDDQAWYEIVTPDTVFNRIGFTEEINQIDLKIAIGKMIEPQSQIMYGKGSQILDYTKKSSQFYAKEEYHNCRVLTTHNHVMFLIRYLQSGKYEMWNHTFLWQECNDQMLDYVVKSDLDNCKNNPGKILIIKGGGRRESVNDKFLNASQKMWKFDHKITSNGQKSQNNCVWLSAILLIDLDDPNIATKMLEMLNESNASYRWMYLTKLPKNKKDGNILIDALRHPDIQFTLKKIDIGKLGIDYIEYLFLEDTVGQYICQLETSGGDRKHVIGIDTDRNYILDASENYAMQFTRENLDYVAGKNENGVRKIVYCYELSPRH